MRPFRYLRDPLFLACCALYVVNRWVMKPHLDGVFLHSWFNDALLIPCALPVLLRLHTWFGWRERDAMPGAGEILAHLIGWSVLFEVIGPRVLQHATGDAMDVVAYAAGAVLAYFWWNRDRLWHLATKPNVVLNPRSIEPVARPNRRTAPTLHLNQDAQIP